MRVHHGMNLFGENTHLLNIGKKEMRTTTSIGIVLCRGEPLQLNH